jgi:hypothetical protein
MSVIRHAGPACTEPVNWPADPSTAEQQDRSGLPCEASLSPWRAPKPLLSFSLMPEQARSSGGRNGDSPAALARTTAPTSVFEAASQQASLWACTTATGSQQPSSPERRVSFTGDTGSSLFSQIPGASDHAEAAFSLVSTSGYPPAGYPLAGQSNVARWLEPDIRGPRAIETDALDTAARASHDRSLQTGPSLAPVLDARSAARRAVITRDQAVQPGPSLAQGVGYSAAPQDQDVARLLPSQLWPLLDMSGTEQSSEAAYSVRETANLGNLRGPGATLLFHAVPCVVRCSGRPWIQLCATIP